MTPSKSPKIAVIAAAGFVAAWPMTATAHQHSHYHTAQAQPTTIIVSCFRGPWDEVIWDRPNPEFTDSLVAAGYSFPEAHAIAERVCRDPNTVGDREGIRAVMIGILASTPPSR